MSALLEQKYEKLFGLLDANGNGVITHHDFEQIADHILVEFEEDRTAAKWSRPEVLRVGSVLVSR